MEKQGGNSGVTLEDLRNIVRPGHLLYTNANESGEGHGTGVISLTSDNMTGIDMVLMEAGYEFIPDRGRPEELSFWMSRNGESEKLRYHPISDFDEGICPHIKSLEIKMRVDFIRLGATSVYDVVKKILEFGYDAIVPPSDGLVITSWIHFTQKDGEYVANKLSG